MKRTKQNDWNTGIFPSKTTATPPGPVTIAEDKKWYLLVWRYLAIFDGRVGL